MMMNDWHRGTSIMPPGIMVAKSLKINGILKKDKRLRWKEDGAGAFHI